MAKGVRRPELRDYFSIMNTSSGPKRPDKGRVSGKEMADALADVLKDQNERAKSRQGHPSDKKRRKTSPVTWVALVGFSIFSGLPLDRVALLAGP